MKIAVLIVASLALVYGDHPDDQKEKEVCPRGFLRLGPACFKLDQRPRTWLEAVEYCRSIDSDLVTVKNESMMRLVTSFLTFEYRDLHYSTPVSYTEGHFWMGGFHRRSTNVEKDKWLWVGKILKDKNGRPKMVKSGRKKHVSPNALMYVPEKDKQQIVAEQAGTPPKDCLLMRHDGVWFNHYCFETLGAVCQTIARGF